MGFYAPAQIVRDAKEHGVEVRPVDVNHSEWDCTLEEPIHSRSERSQCKQTWGLGGPAMRLGFRLIKGMKISHAEHIVACRRQVGTFHSIEHFHRETNLPLRTMQ